MASADTKPAVKGVFEATRGLNGAVVRGNKLNIQQAVNHRKKGYDVVICGPDFKANRTRAETIEKAVRPNGRVKSCGPHAMAGSLVLWHYQQDPKPPQGHTFYETTGRTSQ